MQLRDYQRCAIDRVNTAFGSGARGVFLVLPTGGGKTVIFTEIIRQAVEQGKRCVVVAHRGELIQQAGKTIARVGIQHGVIKAGPSTFPMAHVQVVSIDSMRNRNLPWHPDLIVLDEAHLAKSNRYNQFLAKHLDTPRLLVSATPIRSDGTGFTDIADELVVGSTVSQLITHPDGPFLVPPRIFTGSGELDGLASIKTLGGDYNQGQLEDFMSSTKLVGDVLAQYLTHANGRKGVVFCVGINHSKLVAQQFNQAGIVAEHLDGTLPDAQRAGILARLKSGQTQIVTNASVLCEGWDEPSVSYVGLARPTKSLALYIQQSGRGLRICPEIGKTDCIIVDHGENVERHGHILEDREWSLAGKKAKDKIRKKFKRCKQCDEWIPINANPCPSCGYKSLGRSVDIMETPLEEQVVVILNPVQDEYRKLLCFSATKGYKPGFAYQKLLERFGADEVKAHITFSDSKRMQSQYYYGLLKEPD
jgi:DNA repair protein RadD